MDTNTESPETGEPEAGLAQRLLEIGRECASHLREPFKTIDHGEMLYNDRGLPR